VRLYRDSYNRTNLSLGSHRTWGELDLSAYDEPWDGPGLRFFARFRNRFLAVHITWR
jgi:hypothetical protein